MGLGGALGLEFCFEAGFELVEGLLFFGADVDAGGGESGGEGVGGGGLAAFRGARSGGELRVGAVGQELSGGCHDGIDPLG